MKLKICTFPETCSCVCVRVCSVVRSLCLVVCVICWVCVMQRNPELTSCVCYLLGVCYAA